MREEVDIKSKLGGEQEEQIHKKQRQPNNSETFY